MTYNLEITIPPPPASLKQLADIQAQVLSLGGLVPSCDLSVGIRLNSLRRVSQPTLSLLCDAVLPKICSPIPQFEISFPFLCGLHKRREPSLVFLVPQPARELVNLYKVIATELNKHQFPQPRKFAPRLVIAHPRKSDPQTTKSVLEKVNALAYLPPPPIHISSLCIFQVISTKKGNHYQKLATLPLLSKSPAPTAFC